MPSAKDYYEAGKLADAIAAMNEEVKKHPTDVNRRGFLCELLCFAGEIERIDKQLDTMGDQDPQAMMGIVLWRQLARAEMARQQFFTEGRVPDFLDGVPTEVMKLHMQASILVRDGKNAEAQALLVEAEEKRPRVSGMCDGVAFDDFRDLDDLTSSFFEVLTSTGKYYWVPVEKVESLDFKAPKRPRDLYWRQVHMVVRDEGPDGEVYMPVLYTGSDKKKDDDQIRLGRATDWVTAEGAPVRGLGQRTFLVGQEDKPVLSLKGVTFNAS